ncbi:MAG: hypothetical protein AB7F43_12580 [Bacteriovoracia bacterium]
MKKLLFISFFLSSFAIASEGPIFTLDKTSGIGIYGPYESCEVFKNKVVIHKSFGSGRLGREMEVIEEKKVSLSGDIEKFVLAAENGPKVISANDVCDGPSTSIEAHLTDKTVVLSTTGGCGNPAMKLDSLDGIYLISVVEGLCK